MLTFGPFLRLTWPPSLCLRFGDVQVAFSISHCWISCSCTSPLCDFRCLEGSGGLVQTPDTCGACRLGCWYHSFEQSLGNRNLPCQYVGNLWDSLWWIGGNLASEPFAQHQPGVTCSCHPSLPAFYWIAGCCWGFQRGWRWRCCFQHFACSGFQRHPNTCCRTVGIADSEHL